MEFLIFWEWLNFAARWLHVITAIAWIGSSFYFIALDLGLRRAPGMPEGVSGEEWQVHGGGFYHVQKYMVAPASMPEHLTWFKWESYFTWISGFTLLCLVYYGNARLFLIDRSVLDVSVPVSIAISVDVARRRLDRLRPSVQVADRQQRHVPDGDPLRLRRLRGLGLYASLLRARGTSSSRRVHRDGDVGERVLHHHPEPEEGRRRPDRRQDRPIRSSASRPSSARSTTTT